MASPHWPCTRACCAGATRPTRAVPRRRKRNPRRGVSVYAPELVGHCCPTPPHAELLPAMPDTLMHLPREGPLCSATLVASTSSLLLSPELTGILTMQSNSFAIGVPAFFAVLAASAARQHGHTELAPRAGGHYSSLLDEHTISSPLNTRGGSKQCVSQ
jgi:hypothetical protein